MTTTIFPQLSMSEAVQKFLELRRSGCMQVLMDEAKEVVTLAAPLYKERLCSIPFYKGVENDEHFWSQYVGSRWVEAKAMVEH